jgi:hypothetical protein
MMLRDAAQRIACFRAAGKWLPHQILEDLPIFFNPLACNTATTVE